MNGGVGMIEISWLSHTTSLARKTTDDPITVMANLPVRVKTGVGTPMRPDRENLADEIRSEPAKAQELL